MSALNRDILKDVFYEIIKDEDVIRGSKRRIMRNGFNAKNVDKFMMSGREPFQLVLDIFKKAKSPIFYERCIVAQLPGIKYIGYDIEVDSDLSDDAGYYGYDHDSDVWLHPEISVRGMQIPTTMALFKPISIAIASSMTSLDIRGFSFALIPMLKSIDRELQEVRIEDAEKQRRNYPIREKQIKNILKACTNISNVQNGVIIVFCRDDRLGSLQAIKHFAIPCRKLTIKHAFFNTMHECSLDNPHLHIIRDLVIEGKFDKTETIQEEFKHFIAFIAKTFPNLETLNVKLTQHGCECKDYWNWNDPTLSQVFHALPSQISGSACFKLINRELEEVNREKYPNVQKGADEYYQIFAVRDNFAFKFAYWYDMKREKKVEGQRIFDAEAEWHYWHGDDYY